MVLDRNPQAFQSKIGKYTAQVTMAKASTPVTKKSDDLVPTTASTEEMDEIQSRHIYVCNCKKSNCLKRYCECYLAKIQCSTLCKCINCKNCDESTKTLLQLANAADLRKQQQNKFTSQLQQTNLLKNNLKSSHQLKQNSCNNSIGISNFNDKLNVFNSENLNKNDITNAKIEEQQALSRSYALQMNGTIETTCSRLIDTALKGLNELSNESNRSEESQGTDNSDEEINQIENMVIEEFGRCMLNIIDGAEKRN